MSAHSSFPVRVGAHMGRAFLRWLELVINTATVMLVTAIVGATLILAGMIIAGGPIDGEDFERFFRDIAGSEAKITQPAETSQTDAQAGAPSATSFAFPDGNPQQLSITHVAQRAAASVVGNRLAPTPAGAPWPGAHLQIGPTAPA